MADQKKRIVALVPLRGGSKSIIKKNIKSIAGKPLCEWVLSASAMSKYVDEVYVSTESEEIKNVVNSLNLNVKIIDRPVELAQDKSSTEDVMLHFMDKVNFDLLVTIQATSPLTDVADIDAAIESFFKNNYDSLLTVVRSKRFLWAEGGLPVNYEPGNRPRRQDFDGTLIENGAFYLTSHAVLQKEKCRLGGYIGFHIMDEETLQEIDEPNDWSIVKMMLENKINRGENG